MTMLVFLFACPEAVESLPPKESEPPTESLPVKESEDSEVVPNNPPGTVEIVLGPEVPQPGDALFVTILVPATDLDGDPVSYEYSWSVDGVETEITGDTVEAGRTLMLEEWTVTVTPTDGKDPGPPAVASIRVGNQAPSAPGLALTPTDAIEGETLTLVIDPPAIDPDGDPITTTITWYDDEAAVPWLQDLIEMDGRYVDDGDEIRVVVSVTDGLHEPVLAEVSMTVEYSCTRLPPFNLGETTMSWAHAYHGLDFDDAGALIGYDGRSSIMKSFYDGTDALWVPGVSGLQQFDRLADGDFVVGDSNQGRLVRLSASGATTTISSAVGAVYGVTVGPDGMVYTANGNGVMRTDPTTGETESILQTTGQGITTHSLNFNLDSTVLYIGTIGRGIIYQVPLDADLNPTAAPSTYVAGVGGYHDGLEVDECGNLYVADYSTLGFYRVDTSGNVVSFASGNGSLYGHGTAWGNGVGGWRSDAIYQPQPYNGNTVREVVIGFESGDLVRTWNGVAAPY
jgi:hypothetical protein